MYGTITHYMGTAYTGLGISHKYDELIASATKTVFLKCPPTTAISTVLNQTGTHYVKRGFDIDKFMNPVEPDQTDAIFVQGPNLLFIQASHPVALEPTDIGGKHRVVSFYDIYDEPKLSEENKSLVKSLTESENTLNKALSTLASAKVIHDEWEAVNIGRMDWPAHEVLIEEMKENLFSTMTLNKKSKVSHRLIGSLTSMGASDFIPSITNRIERRLLIKGLPGTGKSTLMKSLGKEAESRGFDVLYGWCGLDPLGVDLVLFPELSLCLIDATHPHNYDPVEVGDEVVDLISMCGESDDAKYAISLIEKRYKETILNATGYMQAHAQAEKKVKVTMDLAINAVIFEEKAKRVLDIN